MSDSSSSRVRRMFTALALGLASFAAAQTASPSQPVETGGFRLPTNYMSRFSSTELLVTNDAGFGVRYFPLPLTTDIRLILVRHPQYWEYALSTRVKDTTFAVGMFNNGQAAASGMPRFEVTHDPFRGVQYGGVYQGNGAFSRFTGGYAFTVAGDRLRVLNNVGVAFENALAAPYTQSEVGGGYGRTFGKLNTYVGGTARAFTFPVQRQAQGSLDLVVAGHLSRARGLSFDGSHFERFAVGSVPFGALNFGRYQESNVSATYRLPGSEAPSGFGLGAVRARATRNWTGGDTYLRGDVLLRAGGLPVFVGPSVGYRWARDPQNNAWLLSLSFLNR